GIGKAGKRNRPGGIALAVGRPKTVLDVLAIPLPRSEATAIRRPGDGVAGRVIQAEERLVELDGIETRPVAFHVPNVGRLGPLGMAPCDQKLVPVPTEGQAFRK